MKASSLIFGGHDLHGFFNNLAFAILRVFAGAAMALAHGWGKFPVSDGMVEGVGRIGLPLPIVFAWAASLAELLGGALVALGLATRPAALFVTITMGVAAFMVHGSDPFGRKEMALLYGAIFLVFTVVGAGRLSLDAVISGRASASKHA